MNDRSSFILGLLEECGFIGKCCAVCRLYGLHANEETKVECTLVHAQNALMVQSRADLAGYRHGHGWGVATYRDGAPEVSKQAWAAYHGEHFRRAAARTYSQTVIAHVRRATVGPASPENTHPFVHDRWVFAHNGTVPGFERLQERFLDAMSVEHRSAVRGVTDSEHVFHLIMTRLEENPGAPLVERFHRCAAEVIGWCRELDADARIGLNLLLTDGEYIVGTRWGRSLFYVDRHGVRDCEICGFPHVHHDPNADYRAIVVASEPISHEQWQEVPERTVFSISPDLQMDFSELSV